MRLSLEQNFAQLSHICPTYKKILNHLNGDIIFLHPFIQKYSSITGNEYFSHEPVMYSTHI